MLTSSDMYWLTRLDGISSGLWNISVGCVVVAIATGFVGGMMADLGGNVSGKDVLRWVRRLVIGSLVAGCVAIFVPTTKEAVAIYVIPAIANNESVRAIPDTAARLADEWLKQKLGEITGEKPQRK